MSTLLWIVSIWLGLGVLGLIFACIVCKITGEEILPCGWRDFLWFGLFICLGLITFVLCCGIATSMLKEWRRKHD